MEGTEWDGGVGLRRGTGGGFSAACLTRRDSCESEAFRKRRTEKRRCLLDCCWTGGVVGRSSDEPDSRLCGRERGMAASSSG